MLLDDHPLLREGLRTWLQDHPEIRVVAEAGSVADALDVVAKIGVDVALVDLGLKGESGIDFMHALKRSRSAIKSVVLSMHDGAEFVASAVEAGASGYILKSAPGDEVLSAIRAAAAGGNYFSAEIAMHLPEGRSVSILTLREREVLKASASEKSNKHIARALGISVRTVESHRLNIRTKLNIQSKVDFMRYAMEVRADGLA